MDAPSTPTPLCGRCQGHPNVLIKRGLEYICADCISAAPPAAPSKKRRASEEEIEGPDDAHKTVRHTFVDVQTLACSPRECVNVRRVIRELGYAIVCTYNRRLINSI